MLSKVLTAVLDWLEARLPAFMAGFAVGYFVMKGQLDNAEKRIADLRLRLAHEENKNKVFEDNDGKSDSDVVDDAINAGGRVPDSPGDEVPYSSGVKKPGKT